MRATGKGLATKWTRTNSSLVDSDKQGADLKRPLPGCFFEFDCGASVSDTARDPARISQKAVSFGQSPLTAFLFQ